MNNLLHMQMLEKYNCEKCRFSTKDVNKYRIHIALHNDMKYVCSYCNFESYTKTEFQRHLVSHTGKFPYTCEYCGYGAIRNDYIVKHIKRIHGDGKIQCSVSTVENDGKNASVNIMQAQMRNSLQEILPNNTSSIAKNYVDPTSEVNYFIPNNGQLIRKSTANADQVEVEVISPKDQQLCPWMPLTVVAPTSFRVPDNCFAQVVEVKPTNSTCYLVIKCLNVSEPNRTGHVSSKESNHEQNNLEAMVIASDSSSLLGGTECLLPPENTAAPIKENPNSSTIQLNDGEIISTDDFPKGHFHEAEKNPISSTSQFNDGEHMSTTDDFPNGHFDDAEEFLDGPIISSVFSLSSDSQNVIEGIQWDNPTDVTNINATKDIVEASTSLVHIGNEPKDIVDASPSLVCMENTSTDIVDTVPSSIAMESQDGLKNEIKDEDKIKSLCEQKSILETEMPDLDISQETPVPLTKPVLPNDKKPESQSSASAQTNKRGRRKSNRPCKKENYLFSRPQTLFLSCDKRIVMQPLSCVLQTGPKASSGGENEIVALKVKRPCAKPKGRIFTKRFSAPTLKTLRLYPAKANQPTQMPHENQPVVVLNHPELDSLEVVSVMKAISMFKGMVLKVTLSKQTRRKIV